MKDIFKFQKEFNKLLKYGKKMGKYHIKWNNFNMNDDQPAYLILTTGTKKDKKEIQLGWADCVKDDSCSLIGINDALKVMDVYHYSRKRDKRNRCSCGSRYSIFSRIPLNNKVSKMALDFLENTL